jgi:hypothetical protein
VRAHARTDYHQSDLSQEGKIGLTSEKSINVIITPIELNKGQEPHHHLNIFRKSIQET